MNANTSLSTFDDVIHLDTDHGHVTIEAYREDRNNNGRSDLFENIFLQ